MERIAARRDFVHRWRQHAIEAGNPFDRFFSAWVALVLAARGYLNDHEIPWPDTDRKAVVHYFEARNSAVFAALDGLPEEVSWLAQRKGTATGKPILDVHPHSRPALRKTFDRLSLVYAKRTYAKPRWIAGATAEMINHVRNNLFHGIKDLDDAADRALLERVNPILIAVLLLHDT